MTCGRVHASYSLPGWKAVKLTLFAPWRALRFKISLFSLCSCWWKMMISVWSAVFAWTWAKSEQLRNFQEASSLALLTLCKVTCVLINYRKGYICYFGDLNSCNKLWVFKNLKVFVLISSLKAPSPWKTWANWANIQTQNRRYTPLITGLYIFIKMWSWISKFKLRWWKFWTKELFHK